MLGSSGWDRLFPLLVAALVVLGAERLPGAVRWVSDGLRQFRAAVNGVTGHARTEFGPELDEMREPLAALAEIGSELRDLTTTPPLSSPTAAPVPGQPPLAESVTGAAQPPFDPQAA
jgi:sec-independent protein translocase protein TatB